MRSHHANHFHRRLLCNCGTVANVFGLVLPNQVTFFQDAYSVARLSKSVQVHISDAVGQHSSFGHSHGSLTSSWDVQMGGCLLFVMLGCLFPCLSTGGCITLLPIPFSQSLHLHWPVYRIFLIPQPLLHLVSKFSNPMSSPHTLQIPTMSDSNPCILSSSLEGLYVSQLGIQQTPTWNPANWGLWKCIPLLLFVQLGIESCSINQVVQVALTSIPSATTI